MGTIGRFQPRLKIMQYIKFTYVDSVTQISVAAEPAANGPAYPQVEGLEFVWARESKYPTGVPEFFGTCPDNANTNLAGVLDVFAQADWETMQADEVLARAPHATITKLAFRNRFTGAEKTAIEFACLDDPSAPMPQRMQSATLRANQADLAAAAFVDLSRPDTRTGVQMLETAGLLAEGRALEILDAQILPEERPQ